MKRKPINEITDKFELLSLIGMSMTNYCYRNNVECDWVVENGILYFTSCGYTVGSFVDYWQGKINPLLKLSETMIEDAGAFIYTVKLI